MRYGLTAMCIGIGMGGAVIWENPHHADYGRQKRSPHERRPPLNPTTAADFATRS